MGRMDGGAQWGQRDWGLGFDLSSSRAEKRPCGVMCLAIDEA